MMIIYNLLSQIGGVFQIVEVKIWVGIAHK